MSVNAPSAGLLTAAYAGHIRYTVNPSQRRAGNHVWDADWCEVADEVMLEGISERASFQSLPTAREGRIDRQRRCHALGGCLRAAPHWPERDG